MYVSMDFDNPKVYGDTSISDGLVVVLIPSLQLVIGSHKNDNLFFWQKMSGSPGTIGPRGFDNSDYQRVDLKRDAQEIVS